jgi:hypothetical protein
MSPILPAEAPTQTTKQSLGLDAASVHSDLVETELTENMLLLLEIQLSKRPD